MDLCRHAQTCGIQFLCAEVARQVHIRCRMNSGRLLAAACSSVWLAQDVQRGQLAAPRNWHAPVVHPTCWIQTRAKVDKTMRYDRHVMLWRVSEHLGTSVKRAHHIVTHVLGYWKIVTVWLPKGLNDEQQGTRVGICWESLLRYESQTWFWIAL